MSAPAATATSAAAATTAYRQLHVGDPAPWFRQRNTSNPDYAFDTVAGRYVLMCFFGSAAQDSGARRLAHALSLRQHFDDDALCCFGISIDPDDETSGRVREALPGLRHFWDMDRRVSRLYGALPVSADSPPPQAFRPFWLLLNPNLQVRAVLPFAADGSDCAAVSALVQGLPPLERFAGMEMHAPVILIPDVFEPDFCARLIGEYERSGGEASGFMRDVDGKTVGVHDTSHKVRRDHLIDDEPLRLQIQARIKRRVIPAIAQVHHFAVTRMERYLVACYDGAHGGHFRPHRDNTTRGTAHRRFALSVILNEGFDGGELAFPEYGPRRYRLAAGAGLVFSCDLLHAVEPVRRGRRFAFLPFLYDEAAATLREANSPHVGSADRPYRAHDRVNGSGQPPDAG